MQSRHQWLFLWLPGAALALAVLLPIGTLAVRFALGGAPVDLVELIGSATVVALLARSATIAFCVTAVAFVIGVPLGLLLGRTDVPARGPLLALHAFPIFVPPFLVALGWFHVLGVNGVLGTPASARWLFSAIGLVFVLGVTLAPIVTGLTAIALRNLDPSLEDAARVIASPVRTAVRILLPTAWPAIALALLLVFALALSELAVPMFLRVRTYPASVFARLGGINYAPGEAVALTLPLVGVTLALLMVERRIGSDRAFPILGLRSRERAVLGLGRWRIPLTLLCAGLALLSLAPVLALALRAVGGGGVRLIPIWIRASLWSSLWSAGVAASVITILSLAAGWALARGRIHGRLLDAALMLGFLTPSAVLGVGLIAAWNHEATRAIYGGTAILVFGLVARYAVIGVRVIATAVAQSSRTLEDAAAVVGASPLRALRSIVVPLHARGIAAAWFLALVFCLRDLDTVVLFYPPGGEPLTVRIFTLEANGPENVVAALAITQIAVTAVLLCALVALMKTRTGRPA